jgi:hypothetical protein
MATIDVTSLFGVADINNVAIRVFEEPTQEPAMWGKQTLHRYHIEVINNTTGEPAGGEISTVMPLAASLVTCSDDTVRWLVGEQISLLEGGLTDDGIDALVSELNVVRE